MRFVVKNFGPIRHADVTLGDFTVFIGPGGTGKSYLAYLIWMLQEMEPDWETLALEIYPLPEFIGICLTVSGEYKKVNEPKVNFDRDFTYSLLTEVMEIAQKAHEKTIERYLKDTFRVSKVKELVTNGEDYCEIQICNNVMTKRMTIRIDENVKITGFKDLVDRDYLIDFVESQNKLRLVYRDTELYAKYLPPNLDIGEISEEVYDFINMAILYIMTNALDGFLTSRASFILTDSKSGFLRFAPSLIRYTLLEARRKGEFPMSFPDIYMLSRLIIDKKEIKNENISKIADFLEEEIGGLVDVETEGFVFPEIFFKKKEGLTIPILRSHSGVRELAPLIIYLRYVIEEERAFIVMEEPETHLHPYMQSVVTRALAMLSKYADVLITTHSPLILDELNNLIKLNKLSPEEKKKLGYREEEGLDPESLKIYRFKLDGTVEEVKVTEDGIEEEEFSSVMMELSNKYADVEELLWRKLHER